MNKKNTSVSRSEKQMRSEAEEIRRNIERTEANQATNADGKAPAEPIDTDSSEDFNRLDSYATD